MKYMWMLLFFALPFLALAYIGWHVWTLVPLPRLWRVVLIGIGVVCFMMTFLNFSRTTDRMPLWVGQLVYDIGNSTLFVLLYMVIIFLVLTFFSLLSDAIAYFVSLYREIVYRLY